MVTVCHMQVKNDLVAPVNFSEIDSYLDILGLQSF